MHPQAGGKERANQNVLWGPLDTRYLLCFARLVSPLERLMMVDLEVSGPAEDMVRPLFWALVI